MRAVNTLCAEVFEDLESYASAPPTDGYLINLLASKQFIQLVAETEGIIVGALSAYVLPKFEMARSDVYIYDLVVDANSLRNGLATALINALKPIARTHGAWVIYVQAGPPDVPAVALYDKPGLREAVLHFDIDVN